MPKKLENWPDIAKIIGIQKRYFFKLTERESAIVGCSVIDLALAHILEARLLDDKVEAESFLGLNEDGRAPAGSFGARIQLALLVGVISPNDAKVFRAFKQIRNRFAHRVDVTIMDSKIQSHLAVILKYLASSMRANMAAENQGAAEKIISFVSEYQKHEKIAKGLLDMALGYVSAALETLMPKVTRLEYGKYGVRMTE